MKLTVEERIVLKQLLSGQAGNFDFLRSAKKLKGLLDFSDDEESKLNTRIDGGMVLWNIAGADSIGEVEIPISELVASKIKDILIDMNNRQKLNEQHLSLYERFVLDS